MSRKRSIEKYKLRGLQQLKIREILKGRLPVHQMQEAAFLTCRHNVFDIKSLPAHLREGGFWFFVKFWGFKNFNTLRLAKILFTN